MAGSKEVSEEQKQPLTVERNGRVYELVPVWNQDSALAMVGWREPDEIEQTKRFVNLRLTKGTE